MEFLKLKKFKFSKKNVLLLSLIVVALGAIGFAAYSYFGTRPPADAPDSGQVIAVVNGENVSKDDFDELFNANKEYMASLGLDVNSEDSKQILASMEEDAWNSTLMITLILQDAKKLGVALSDKAVTKYYNEQVEKAFPDKADYASWLEENKMTERQVWESMRNTLDAQAIYDKLGQGITITDEQTQETYDKDPSQWETRKASHIIIIPTDDSDEALATAEAKAKDLISQLNNGADFATLAKANSMDGTASDGGSLGDAFGRYNSNLDEDFVAAVYALQNVGDYSKEPVKTSYGYHIIKLDEKNDTFDVLKDSIKESLLSQAKDEAYSQHMQELKDSAKVEMKYTFQYWQPNADSTESDTTQSGQTSTEQTSGSK